MGIGLVLMFATSPLLALETLNSRYFDSTALVFKHSDLRNRKLPDTIHTLNLPIIFSNRLALSCLGVRPGRDGVLVFRPDTNTCMSLDHLRVSGLPDKGKNKTGNMGIERERMQLLSKLESNALVVILPQVRAVAIAGVCICPPSDQPDLIFFDGFEAGLF